MHESIYHRYLSPYYPSLALKRYPIRYLLTLSLSLSPLIYLDQVKRMRSVLLPGGLRETIPIEWSGAAPGLGGSSSPSFTSANPYSPDSPIYKVSTTFLTRSPSI